MGLLHSIQESVLDPDSGLAPLLLRVRLLAARLGSQPLADWVRHESDGYPDDAAVPDYRVLDVSYKASFSGPYGSGINNAPIPPHLIEKFAGTNWTEHRIRQSMAAIDELVAPSADGGGLGINADNLMLLLQGKVYPGYNCFTVSGSISRAAVVALQHAVRSRILELTVELEKSVPGAAEIAVTGNAPASAQQAAAVTQITQQIIYGGVTSITANDNARVTVVNGALDQSALAQVLKESGITEDDAKELTEIVASEKPESTEEPFGKKARAWLLKNLHKAGDGSWKVGIGVATSVIKEAVLRYYGLK